MKKSLLGFSDRPIGLVSAEATPVATTAEGGGDACPTIAEPEAFCTTDASIASIDVSGSVDAVGAPANVESSAGVHVHVTVGVSQGDAEATDLCAAIRKAAVAELATLDYVSVTRFEEVRNELLRIGGGRVNQTVFVRAVEQRKRIKLCVAVPSVVRLKLLQHCPVLRGTVYVGELPRDVVKSRAKVVDGLSDDDGEYVRKWVGVDAWTRSPVGIPRRL